jgi:hypothetical protein
MASPTVVSVCSILCTLYVLVHVLLGIAQFHNGALPNLAKLGFEVPGLLQDCKVLYCKHFRIAKLWWSIFYKNVFLQSCEIH